MSTPKKIIRHPELKPRYGIDYSYQHCSRLGAIGRFPKKVRLSYRCVGWFEDEIEAWLEERRLAAAEASGQIDAKAA
jgi:predicted DNA-binding transcriptional regulator AlpA